MEIFVHWIGVLHTNILKTLYGEASNGNWNDQKNVFTPFCDLIISCKPLEFHAEIIIISTWHTHKNREKRATFGVCYLTFVILYIGLYTRVVKETTSINHENNIDLHSDNDHRTYLEIAGGKYFH